MIVSIGFNGKQDNMNMSTGKHEISQDWPERFKIIKKRFYDVFEKECTYENIEEYLGITRGKMAARVRSLSAWSADDIMVLHEKLDLSLEWIFYGNGPMLNSEKQPSEHAYVVNESVAEYDEKYPKQRLLDQCRQVLDSDSFYASALESNIIAFNSAVLAEAVQKNMEARMSMLQTEINKLKISSSKGKAVGDMQA